MTALLLRPNALVPERVYVVVTVGFTTTEFPRTAPTCGATRKYDAPVTFHFKVTACPAETVAGVAVKLPITGFVPVGTLLGV